jgi:hypothetical protein
MPISERDEIERLNWRLRMHTIGPVAAMARQAAAPLLPLVQSLADGLIESARMRPIATLPGFAIARLWRKHAQR